MYTPAVPPFLLLTEPVLCYRITPPGYPVDYAHVPFIHLH